MVSRICGWYHGSVTYTRYDDGRESLQDRPACPNAQARTSRGDSGDPDEKQTIHE